MLENINKGTVKDALDGDIPASSCCCDLTMTVRPRCNLCCNKYDLAVGDDLLHWNARILVGVINVILDMFEDGRIIYSFAAFESMDQLAWLHLII